MSDPRIAKLKVIPAKAEVTLKFSGHFHKRLTAVYFNYIKKIDTAVFEKLAQHLDKNELDKLVGDELSDAVVIQTLLILIGNLEKEFTDAGLAVDKEYEFPTED